MQSCLTIQQELAQKMEFLGWQTETLKVHHDTVYGCVCLANMQDMQDTKLHGNPARIGRMVDKIGLECSQLRHYGGILLNNNDAFCRNEVVNAYA